MESPKLPINTISLSKEAYDKLKNENMKCKMLLDSVFNNLKFVSDESDDIIVDAERITAIAELCYPTTFKEKRSYMKAQRTKKRMKEMEAK